MKNLTCFFKIVGIIVTIVVLLFWFVVSFKCIQHGIDGQLFFEKTPHENGRKNSTHISPQECNSPSRSKTRDNSDGGVIPQEFWRRRRNKFVQYDKHDSPTLECTCWISKTPDLICYMTPFTPRYNPEK